LSQHYRKTEGSDVYPQVKSVVFISDVTAWNQNSVPVLGITVPNTDSAENDLYLHFPCSSL